MDIFEYSDVRLPSRSLMQQDEEEQHEATSHLYLEPAIVLRNDKICKDLAVSGKLQPEVLLVACSRPACALLQSAFPAAQTLGSIVLADVSMEGNCALPSIKDDTCFLHSCGRSGEGALVSCQYSVPPERATAWVKGLFSAVQPRRTIVIGSMSAESFRGEGDPSQSCLMYTLQTSAQRAAAGGLPPAVPYLSTGNVVSGPIAALLNYCEVSPGRIMTGWQGHNQGGALKCALNRETSFIFFQKRHVPSTTSAMFSCIVT